MKPYMKFGILIVVVVSTLGWIAIGSVDETKTYYKTVPEIQAMGRDAQTKRLRVAGDVVQGSIKRQGKEVSFEIVQLAEEQAKEAAKPATAVPSAPYRLRVIYTGSEPLPDTFRDGAQALAEGRMQADGTFAAAKIQAKCASKYEAKPGSIKKGTEPVYTRPELSKRT